MGKTSQSTLGFPPVYPAKWLNLDHLQKRDFIPFIPTLNKNNKFFKKKGLIKKRGVD